MRVKTGKTDLGARDARRILIDLFTTPANVNMGTLHLSGLN